jgi:hypothetical protein
MGRLRERERLQDNNGHDPLVAHHNDASVAHVDEEQQIGLHEENSL